MSPRSMSPRREWTAALASLLSLGLACTSPPGARADDAADAMNRVQFQVERSRRVANDRITAVVGVTDEDSEAARLADRVNQAMTWALGEARGREGVEVESGRYQTWPIQQDGKIRRWRASQDLVLTSADTEALTLLVGDLQSRLLVRSVSFEVSPERRRSVQDELITECLGAYRERAERVKQGLGARGYALVGLSIDTSAGFPQPRFARAQEAYASVKTAAPPALEAGESELSVRIDATIELED